MWFKGYGEYEGKIMELTMNEKDAAETEEDDNPNLYMLEGIVMDEPTDDWWGAKHLLKMMDWFIREMD